MCFVHSKYALWILGSIHLLIIIAFTIKIIKNKKSKIMKENSVRKEETTRNVEKTNMKNNIDQ
jgi:hypothetical protein